MFELRIVQKILIIRIYLNRYCLEYDCKLEVRKYYIF